MKVLVNKCPYTGKIFEEDKKYSAHLQKLRRERHRKMREARAREEFYEWLAEEKEKIFDLDMLSPWILANQKKLMEACNALKLHTWSSDRFYPETDEFTKFEIKVKWNSHVSNSHSCPKGGVQNWCSKDTNKPTGYPGWSGRIEGILTRDKKHIGSYPSSGFCKLLSLHIGSGGGGNANWGHELRIFADDWPVMASSETFARLVNGPV